MLDVMGLTCFQCHNGTYQETTIYDDWDGKLHCTNCDVRVDRHQPVEEDANEA